MKKKNYLNIKEFEMRFAGVCWERLFVKLNRGHFHYEDMRGVAKVQP